MMTLDEIREKRKAWETEQERLWRAFRASWTPEQVALYRRHQNATKQLARLTLWQHRFSTIRE